ncbi:MAG: putative CDP-glycerol:glycerophosphate glycerophosphotransferase [Chlamydiae bacterium]|nr:putative CDP-glycerol:glycerophosphate glycerophosphotransferase [Chlamydiota bacterium]
MKAAISTGPETHLDHLAPICFSRNIPLIVTDLRHLDIAKAFYPMVESRYVPLSEMTLEYIAKNFNEIVTCGKFWAMELQPLVKLFFNKTIRFVFAPHGYSDKEDLLKMPVEQDIELSYEKEGNYRLWFYNEHKSHFDALAAKFFQTEKKVVLYAPTWETKATSSSFFESIDAVIQALGEHYHLLIKLHPLLEENDPAAFHRILGKYEKEFIVDFPAIYPLLEKTDIYLGDFSSIGYDFLAYDRPLFFLKEGGKLQECGQLFRGSVEDPQKELSDVRKQLYENVFGQKNPRSLKRTGS